MSALDPPTEKTVLALPGLEHDNLLAFLALLGLLRALERAQPTWQPRASWDGPPWQARLHLAEVADEAAVAAAATAGIEAIAEKFDVDGRSNVSFTREEFRTYAERLRTSAVGAALAAALAAELPEKRDRSLHRSPLVFLGAGHLRFLDRLVSVPRGDLPSSLKNAKHPPEVRSPAKVAEALFAPWTRQDPTDAFRWDPQEDQRHALRFRAPTKDGAAPTVQGANRLAALGFLSFVSAPGIGRPATRGIRWDNGPVFVWPLWRSPLALQGIEALLSHPAVLTPEPAGRRLLGVGAIMAARRVSNDRYWNATRAAETP